MSEENKALVRRYIEQPLGGDFSLYDDLLAPDFRMHSAGLPAGISPGPEAMKQLMAGYNEMFPDLVLQIEDEIAVGDRVVVRWSSSGTHSGDGMGISATGNPIRLTGTSIYRIADGQIAEEWEEFDRLGLMQQLGLVPAELP